MAIVALLSLLSMAANCDQKGPVAPSTTTTTTTTIPPPPNISAFLGTFTINATKAADTGCNFQNTFSGTFQLSGNNDGSNLTARMVERLTRIYAGSMQSNGAFTTSGTGNLDGFVYSGTVTGTATATSISGTEVMNFSSGCPGRSVTYNFTGNK